MMKYHALLFIDRLDKGEEIRIEHSNGEMLWVKEENRYKAVSVVRSISRPIFIDYAYEDALALLKLLDRAEEVT